MGCAICGAVKIKKQYTEISYTVFLNGQHDLRRPKNKKQYTEISYAGFFKWQHDLRRPKNKKPIY